MGGVDAFQYVEAAKPNLALFNKYVSVMTAGQIRAIVDKNLKDRPQDWHLAMASIVFSAVIDACEPGQR